MATKREGTEAAMPTTDGRRGAAQADRAGGQCHDPYDETPSGAPGAPIAVPDATGCHDPVDESAWVPARP
ncbi:hypothetical protein K6U06_00640 [Acidiferrimicrobium sp. IK]|uniref:hypothetical protein n=1 Tax=Acidiferrimicrobium sp. IK TaxID=2871700 RepID=UPI0021CB5E3E|nr:hypothetical protein [Acidiferrimicrobium sp. IK]MCU4182853.1 hypothetical protein [Acidiferrimicrobium sp. IK]